MRPLVESMKFIRAADPKDYVSAAFAGYWVSMKLYKHLTIVITTGAWAAGTAAVTVEEATHIAGTANVALGFSFMWTDEAATGTLVKTAVTSNTFNLDTASKLYIIEIDAEDLTRSLSKDCVTVKVATPGANADLYCIDYILSGARFAMDTPPSAILD